MLHKLMGFLISKPYCSFTVILKSPSFPHLRESYPLESWRLMLQNRRPGGHILWEHLSPHPAVFFFFSLRPPFPVISYTCRVTLPVTEAAALEEQIAAGHRANLA